MVTNMYAMKIRRKGRMTILFFTLVDLISCFKISPSFILALKYPEALNSGYLAIVLRIYSITDYVSIPQSIWAILMFYLLFLVHSLISNSQEVYKVSMFLRIICMACAKSQKFNSPWIV